MAHIGRNDPCPCGSGKKYKKCCIDKETNSFPEELKSKTNQSSEDKWEDEEKDDSLFGLNDFGSETDEFDDQDTPATSDNFENFEDEVLDEDEKAEEEVLSEKTVTKKDPRYNYQLRGDTSPEISDEEDKLIDEWYDKYHELEDPRAIQLHIEDFMEKYPKLVENMELHHEVIFELGAAYLRIGKNDDFIQFLFRFRKDFPASYLKSFGYYDYDIIIWLISKNRIEEIPEYLENFIKYPVDFVEKLFELLDLLNATNNSSIALFLVEKVYSFVFYSPEVIGGGSIVSPLIIELYSKFLHLNYTDEEIDQLVESMKKIEVDLIDQYHSSTFWKSMFDTILKPYSRWSDSAPRKKAAFHKLHNEMVTNFLRFLKEKTGISWTSANYFTEKLSEYFYHWIEKSQKPHKVTFDFSPGTMDKTIFDLIGKMIWIDFTSYVGHYNAIYYFADYLFVCGNIDENQRDKIQNDCSGMYNKPLEQLTKQYEECLVFGQFPLWGKIQY